MKIVLVGDLFIPGMSCRAELDKVTRHFGGSFKILDWQTADLEELNRRNVNIEKNGPASEEPPKELWAEIKDADILIAEFCPVPAKLIMSADHLQLIGTMRTGLSNIDVPGGTAEKP